MAPSVRFHPTSGKYDEVCHVRVRIDVADGVAYRIAPVSADLVYATWMPVPAAAFETLYSMPGFQVPALATIAVEVQFADDTTIVVTDAIARIAHFPPEFPLVAPTKPAGYLFRATFAQPIWWVQQYNDTVPHPGNNFLPLMWSPGYGWSTEHTRGIDVGETPNDIIAAHVYARWVNPALNEWNFASNTTFYSVSLDGDIDLKGGGAYLAVLCSFPDGKRGRYHLRGQSGSPRELVIGGTTARYFPSGSHPDWVCSYAADGVGLAAMPHGPSFRIEAVEIVLRDFITSPTGQLQIKEFAIGQ